MARSGCKVTMWGYLGADPDVRYSPDGICFSSMSLGVTETWKGKGGEHKEKTSWHTLKANGKLAELTGELLKKGSHIMVFGKLDRRSYEDRDTKKTVWVTETRISELHILDKLEANAGNNSYKAAKGGNQQQPSAPQRQSAPYHPAPDFDSDVPF